MLEIWRSVIYAEKSFIGSGPGVAETTEATHRQHPGLHGLVEGLGNGRPALLIGVEDPGLGADNLSKK